VRLSVTDLDSWRYYKASEDMDVEALLRRLRKQEPPTQPMLAGRALHKVLEHIQEGDLACAEAEGFTFKFLAECEVQLLPVRELKGEAIIKTASGPVTLVGVIDGMDGSIYDHKLTERFDAERYADSYQWRCYLTMFGAKRFVYNVFEGREGDKPNEWLIHGFQRFPLYAYEGMREDVVREVVELADFVAKHVPEKAAA
jgi:hypothetical protein